jgi:hypothetical protein
MGDHVFLYALQQPLLLRLSLVINLVLGRIYIVCDYRYRPAKTKIISGIITA